MRNVFLAVLAAAFGITSLGMLAARQAGPALAQDSTAAPSAQSTDPGDVVPIPGRGVTSPNVRAHAISGTIMAIDGNRVTLGVGDGVQITINDQLALNRRLTGHVTVGRAVTASGYWQDGTFFATALT